MAEDDLDRGSVENPAARLISLSEAAELFGLSHSHLRKLAREGKLRLRQGETFGPIYVKAATGEPHAAGGADNATDSGQTEE